MSCENNEKARITQYWLASRASLAFLNPTQFGYFGGGTAPSDNSTIQRIEYANDTATTSRRAILTRQTNYMGTAGNSFFGYFAAGDGSPSDTSVVDRMQYANDTATTLVRGPLSSQRRDLAGAGNTNFGYFVGIGYFFHID